MLSKVDEAIKVCSQYNLGDCGLTIDVLQTIRATITEQAARISQLESERSDALILSKQCTDRGMEVERQMAELKSNYKVVSQATHDAFSDRIKALEDALREVKHCMSNVNVDSRWFDRGIATINELIGE